jgi:hypothetical protein
MTTMEVAKTILEQLGGNRFVAMTGAKYLLGGENELQFQIGSGAAKGINAVRITLDATDTYTMRFYKIGRGARVSEIAAPSGVYAEDLRRVFEQHTGLLTSL